GPPRPPPAPPSVAARRVVLAGAPVGQDAASAAGAASAASVRAPARLPRRPLRTPPPQLRHPSQGRRADEAYSSQAQAPQAAPPGPFWRGEGRYEDRFW